MSSSALHPSLVKRVGRTAIDVLWSDGHRSLYPNDYLRNKCPCAGCVRRPPRVLPVMGADGQELYAVQLSSVGRYAINIAWSDGHDAGIYSFRTLREVCPCGACPSGAHARRAEGHGDDR